MKVSVGSRCERSKGSSPFRQSVTVLLSVPENSGGIAKTPMSIAIHTVKSREPGLPTDRKGTIEMKPKKEIHALYQGAVMVTVKRFAVSNGKRVAAVVFDNGEEAVVSRDEIRTSFDLMEGCEA